MWPVPPTKRDLILIGLLISVCVLTVLGSTVRRANGYACSDPYGSLLTSQSLLQQGTVKLDAYGSPESLKEKYQYRVRRHAGHVYYYFPVGTPLAAAPFVGLARLFSRDMAIPRHDWMLQGLLAALTVGVIALLGYTLARFRLKPGEAMLLTALFVGGSSIASTCGTALWSFNFELVFILLSLNIVFILLSQQARHTTALSACLGFSLFLAYLCRPSALVMVAGCVCLLVLSRKFSAGLITILAMAFCLLLFARFSLSEYGTVLPPYYRFSRLSHADTFWTAFLGNLASPSRGLLVFSPHYLIVLLAGLCFWRREFFLLAFCYGWLLLEIIAVSRLPHWWGGHSFGPRLLTDTVPAIFVIGLLTAAHVTGRRKALFWALLLITGTVSMAIHSGQGLYNAATLKWNSYPDVDQNQEHLFDWRCPQFMATSSLLENRLHPPPEPQP